MERSAAEDGDDDDAAEYAREQRRAVRAARSDPWYGDWSWVWMGFLLALVMIGGDVLVNYKTYFPEGTAQKIEEASEDGW